MTTITATAFKTNFKYYGNLASKGERILVKRPKDEPNLVVMNEGEYKELNRLMTYYKELFENASMKEESKSQSIDISSMPNSTKKRNIIGLAKGKIYYPENFDEMNDEITISFCANEDIL